VPKSKDIPGNRREAALTALDRALQLFDFGGSGVEYGLFEEAILQVPAQSAVGPPAVPGPLDWAQRASPQTLNRRFP
jgi:hypothetical protein